MASNANIWGIIFSEPRVWYVIFFFCVLGYVRWNRDNFSKNTLLFSLVIMGILYVPLYMWGHPNSGFFDKSVPIIRGENYALNAPYVFPLNVRNFPHRVDVFSIMNCSPGNRKIKAVIDNLPTNYKIIYHDISQPNEGTMFHDIMLPTGKVDNFVGPVFILNGKAFFYNEKIIEQIKNNFPV